MNVIERIETLIGSECLSTNAFAYKVGVNPSNLGKMLAGKQRITDKTLRKIESATGCNFGWLKCGEGEMFSNQPQANSATINSHNENSNINGGDTISRLLSQLEEKDRQINRLLQIILDQSVRVMKLNEQIKV